jgi:tartrate dehydrogenase/decarboxylase/D-malate dehydrogenase
VSHRVGLLAGDGIGPEVIAVAKRVVDALDVRVEWEALPWGSRFWHRHGSMMPDDWAGVMAGKDALLVGAIGDPSVPDHVSVWGTLLTIRQELDLWANVRPVRLLDGVASPLTGREPRDVDMLFIRENTEGEYAGVGGRVHRGLPHELAMETSVFSTAVIERLMRYGFSQARGRRGVLTSATKSNASRYGYVLWDEVAATVASDFTDVRYERVHVDALAARMVSNPSSLDVVVASNLFGDILTDLGAAIQGGMGMAASANVKPGGKTVGLFEPVHGSAPDIAGKGIANPLGCVWSAALMLEFLGEDESAIRVMDAISKVTQAGLVTPDLGGHSSTEEVGEAVVTRLAADGEAPADLGGPARRPSGAFLGTIER